MIPSQTKDYQEAYSSFLTLKKTRTEKLSQFKDAYSNTPEFLSYKESKAEADKAYSQLKDIEKKENYRGFQTFQQFLGEFGWAIGLFIYAMFNLFTALHERRKDLAMMHSVLLFISIFYVYYVFQPFQDLSKLAYVVAAIISAVVIAFATHYYLRYAFEHVEALKRKVRVLIGFVAKTTAPNNKEEMWDVLEEVSN